MQSIRPQTSKPNSVRSTVGLTPGKKPMRFVQAMLCLLVLVTCVHSSAAPAHPLADHIVGMYIHEHWPYNHPYAARTLTLDDWRGYADGLKKLGFNTIMIWPMIEIMPDPLLPSDQASLEKDTQVIDMLHRELGMRVMIVLTPNVIPDDNIASRAPFEARHFFYSDLHVNPADANAVAQMMKRREKLMKYFSKADAVAIIDSDPGGFPGSSNAEFIHLLEEHRKMLDGLRPGIELDYWIDWGWQAYGRFYKTGVLTAGPESEFIDALSRLRKADPEPWGLANGLSYAKRLGLESRVISFNYGSIEGEPSFPLTDFGGDKAYKAGSDRGPRGVMGNAQTHCVQLPNTFAFARGATGKPVPLESDYVSFANDLIEGQGRTIVNAWEALAGQDPKQMRNAEATLRLALSGHLTEGPLHGLLLGDPRRFINDLLMELDAKATFEEFVGATRSGRSVHQALAAFVSAADAWQKQNGFQGDWHWPQMEEALKTLHSPEIDEIFKVNVCLLTCPAGAKPTGYQDVKQFLYKDETMSTRLLTAMHHALEQMH